MVVESKGLSYGKTCLKMEPKPENILKTLTDGSSRTLTGKTYP